jgi:hypothetical protein
MTRLTQYSVYAIAAALVVIAASGWPPYRPLAPDEALLLVSFAHPSRPEGPCRARTEAELARLPPNMRAPEVCPRRRIAVPLRVELDGSLLVEETLFPAGLERDGSASIHRRIPLAAGHHELRVRMLDEERTVRVALAPGQVLRIDYRAGEGVLIL